MPMNMLAEKLKEKKIILYQNTFFSIKINSYSIKYIFIISLFFYDIKIYFYPIKINLYSIKYIFSLYHFF